MASSWIRRRTVRGKPRFDVQFRAGGRESAVQHAGTFPTLRLARARQRWVEGELAAMRMPDVRQLVEAPRVATLESAGEAWKASRVDVAENTRTYHAVALARALPTLGELPVDRISAENVVAMVAQLHKDGRKRSSIRKTLNVMAQVLDHAGVDPNPARDRRVRLPREVKEEVSPPTARHVEATLAPIARRYRLPVIVLDATGQRVGELESLTWGDVDVPEGRWRVTHGKSKTGQARWVQVPADVLSAVLATCPPEDREADRPVFPGLTQANLRQELARACRAAQVPRFSPHDLRHRRISLWHRDGVPWANIGQRVGQRNLSTTADTYTHVIVEGELDRAGWL